MTTEDRGSYGRTGVCFWCNEVIIDGRTESGYEGDGYDWMTNDHDFGCGEHPITDEDGTGPHEDLEQIVRYTIEHHAQDDTYLAMRYGVKMRPLSRNEDIAVKASLLHTLKLVDKPKCKRGCSVLNDEGYCTDLTCPHSDYKQDETWTEG